MIFPTYMVHLRSWFSNIRAFFKFSLHEKKKKTFHLPFSFPLNGRCNIIYESNFRNSGHKNFRNMTLGPQNPKTIFLTNGFCVCVLSA